MLCTIFFIFGIIFSLSYSRKQKTLDLSKVNNALATCDSIMRGLSRIEQTDASLSQLNKTAIGYAKSYVQNVRDSLLTASKRDTPARQLSRAKEACNNARTEFNKLMIFNSAAFDRVKDELLELLSLCSTLEAESWY